MTPIDYLTPQAKTYRIEEIPSDQLSVEGDPDKLLIPCAHFHKGAVRIKKTLFLVVELFLCIFTQSVLFFLLRFIRHVWYAILAADPAGRIIRQRERKNTDKVGCPRKGV